MVNRIDILIRKAKTSKNGNLKYVLGFIDYDKEKRKFVLVGDAWDGKTQCSIKTFHSECDTLEEAYAECDRIANAYPNHEQAVFIYDDIEGMGE